MKLSTSIPSSCRDSQKICWGEIEQWSRVQNIKFTKNSSERQVATFQHAKGCSSTVSLPSFCILIHSQIYVFLQSTISAIYLGKRKSYIKIFKTWRSLSEFSPRVQFWVLQSPSISSFTLSEFINLTSYLCCQQGQHNKHKSNLGTKQGSRTK